MKPRPTTLKFTQRQVTLIVCLLVRNRTRPFGAVGCTPEEWERDVESLTRKFHSIDWRYPAQSPLTVAADEYLTPTGECNSCGGTLVYVAGPDVTAALCPVCDADSSALDQDERRLS